MKVILIYLLIINLLGYVLMYIDKKKSIKHQYRISEKTLFITALIGGCYGSLIALITLHHKNKKIQFWIIYMISIIIYTYILFKIIGG